MTNQYKIAVLLPTRGRTDTLSRSVMGLLNRAVMLDKVQILFGFDNDDDVGRTHFVNELEPWLDKKGIDYTAIEFEPLGYGRLNEYVNALARASSADWLFFWNDDALMDSSGWDKQIIDRGCEFKLLSVHTHRDHPYSIFPIVPRAWMDVLGYLSPHPLNDAWLSQIAYQLNIFERIPVHVTHDRSDLTGNNNDETFKSRNMSQLEGNPNNPKDFHNPAWISLRINETEKIAAWMKSQQLDITWWENVKAGKQDPWEQLKINDTNSQMAHFKLSIAKNV